MSYTTHAMATRTTAPVTLTWMAPQPAAYLSSVSEPRAPSHAGKRNQVRGEASITAARFQVRAETKQDIHERLQHALAKTKVQWALTGADAAERRTHFFHAEDTEIYARIAAFEDRAVLKGLVAQPATRGGSLVVIEPPAPVATANPRDDELPIAPDLLTYAELRYRGGAQALEAAEMLLPTVAGRDAR